MPKYEIESVVYLRESASRGFLESYTILSRRQNLDGIWRYTIGVPAAPPYGITTVGDRNNLKHQIMYEVLEDDLINICEALDIIIPYHERALDGYKKLRSSKCSETG